MLEQNSTEIVDPSKLRTLQIICGANLVGVVSVGVVVAIIVQATGKAAGLGPEASNFITIVAAVVMLTTIPLAFTVPEKIVDIQLQKLRDTSSTDNEKTLWGLMTTKTILFFAMIEGPAILSGIAYLIEANPWSLGLMASAAGVMVMHFPTASKVATTFRRWRERIGLETASREF